MKILIIPTSYPDEQNRVRNVFIYEQAVALAKAGHDVRVLHPQKQPSRQLFSRMNNEIRTIREDYAIRYCCPVKTFMADRFVLFNKVLFVKAVYRLYDEAVADRWKPDVIYAHFSCWAGVAAVELGQKHKIPVVVMEHFSGYMCAKPQAKLVAGLDYVVKNADAVVCVSEKLKNKVLQLTNTKKNIQVVPNMIDHRFQYVNRNATEEFVFCSVCNLNERKRVKELVDAFCNAFDEKERVKLLIGGDGPEKRKITESIQRNHREHQIVLLGRLDRNETVDLYSKSNCFALVSAHETFGIVWREAMATGLPVITSDHEGWSTEDWSDDFGIMVPVDDEHALVKALKDMKENFMQYDGRKISAYCYANYSESVVAKQIEGIFRGCYVG